MIDKISPEILLKQMEQLKDNMNVDQPFSPETGKAAEGDFKEVFGNLIKDVDESQKAADVSLKKLATGETTSIQEVVLKMEQADISFKLMKEIRDKLLQAYKDIISTS
ncbi:MAG: flagellar hook-basal body complex protein FliE [Lentisphaerae bacterium GWF2_44_16]|nr:MAG: flagellar hook-basal body complex protein FliE [Lentisphaerae bacterium GWF2_44_16]